MATLTISRAQDTNGNPHTGYLQTNDGQVLYTVTSDVSITVNPGNIIVFNKGTSAVALPSGVTTADGLTSIPVQSFKAIPGTGQTGAVDITQDAYADLVNCGQVSDAPDKDTGRYYLIGYHHGSHVAHGQHVSHDAVSERHVGTGQLHGGENSHKDHHASKSHARRHDQPHKPSRHHHHNGVMMEFNGTTLTVTGGSMDLDDGASSVSIYGTTLGPCAVGGWILVSTSGGYPYYQGSFSESGGDNITVMARVGPADADGNLTTEGWHHGPHKVHEKHIKSNAVKSQHIAGGAVHGGENSNPNHIASSAIQSGHVANSAIQSGHIATGQIHGGENSNINHIADSAVQEGHVSAGQIHGGENGHRNHIANSAIQNKHVNVINGYYSGQANFGVAAYNQWTTTSLTFNWKQVFSEAQLYANITGLNSGGGTSETFNGTYEPVVLWNTSQGAPPQYGEYSIVTGTIPAGSQIAVTNIQINPGDPATATVTFQYYVQNTGTVTIGIQFLLATGVS